ncbi:MAG: hypothetical protein L3J98_00885 [Gammaproteobacteria bacterium]|nr:hypothetical protein [Gammaproteobacteria bacterium]
MIPVLLLASLAKTAMLAQCICIEVLVEVLTRLQQEILTGQPDFYWKECDEKLKNQPD